MWGCDYGPVVAGWWSGFFTGSIFSQLLCGLIIVLVVFLAIRIFRSQTDGLRGPVQDRFDSEAILKTRFAKGEISRKEFVRMREILSQT
ncbi:MAG: hypothetical protein WBB19_05925 [Desulforhopalus sp.]